MIPCNARLRPFFASDSLIEVGFSPLTTSSCLSPRTKARLSGGCISSPLRYTSLVSEKEFPSGPWVGFYTYSGAHDKHRMDLGLTFASGRISGGGNDDIGPFIIAGRFDAANGECHWTKTYVGAHDVFYCGFRENKSIWGTWEILSDARGGFHIWPRAHRAGNEEAVSAEEEVPVLAFEVYAPASHHR